MEKNIWKKYGVVDFNNPQPKESYDELYDDLKDSGKEWEISFRHDTCKNHLTGENEFRPGDIYVYYHVIDGKLIPEFYLKIMELYNPQSKKNENMVMFNGSTLGHNGIDEKHLPELIAKLREIDEEKNKKYIIDLEERYENYKRLLFLQSKKDYTEDELLFIYYMAYNKKSSLALLILKDRDLEYDFANFSDVSKTNLFMIIKDEEPAKEISITSSDILLGIAKSGTLKQLSSASEELIANKELIIKVLQEYFEASKNLISFDLEDYLPLRYQSDLDVLKFIFEHLRMDCFTFWMWIQKNPELKAKMADSSFVYQIMNNLVSSYVKADTLYPMYATYLTSIPDGVVDYIENYLLIGPESTEKREKLKQETLTLIQKEKQLVLARRALKRAS